MRKPALMAAMAAAFGMAGCASVHNLPLNTASANPLAGFVRSAAAAEAEGSARAVDIDDTAIGLAFSGGGTRAAAFSYGVLEQLARTPRRGRGDLLDEVAVVSGVSGGSVTAAYFGLKGREALQDFRARFLIQDVMASLDTRVSLVNINRALGGGANTDERLRNWLNANLFHDATFEAVYARRRPLLLINATDVYSRTPFVFAPQIFAAICSDLTQYPLAGAVAASAAVPAAFAPVVLKTFPEECKTPLPAWVQEAGKNTSGSPLLHGVAKSLIAARSGEIKYIKLFDGGMVDNFGLSSITIARAAARTPYGPLRPEEAVRLRRLLFLVVDAGRAPQGDWSQTVEGPAGRELVGAVFDAIIDANSQSSYTAFEATLHNWRDAIVRWRCGLKPAEAARLRGRGSLPNCRDLKITVGRVSFDVLDGRQAEQLNKVPTSFSLPAATVDELTRAGGEALQANPAFRTFVKEM